MPAGLKERHCKSLGVTKGWEVTACGDGEKLFTVHLLFTHGMSML